MLLLVPTHRRCLGEDTCLKNGKYKRKQTRNMSFMPATVLESEVKTTKSVWVGQQKAQHLDQIPIQMFTTGLDHDSLAVRQAMHTFMSKRLVELLKRLFMNVNRHYKTPSRNRADIRQNVQYPGSPTWSTISADTDEDHDIQSSAYDALRKSPERLGLSDEWMSAEEFFCLHVNSDSAAFVARGAGVTLGLPELIPYLAPNLGPWVKTEGCLLQLRQQKAKHSPSSKLKAAKHEDRTKKDGGS